MFGISKEYFTDEMVIWHHIDGSGKWCQADVGCFRIVMKDQYSSLQAFENAYLQNADNKRKWSWTLLGYCSLVAEKTNHIRLVVLMDRVNC